MVIRVDARTGHMGAVVAGVEFLHSLVVDENGSLYSELGGNVSRRSPSGKVEWSARNTYWPHAVFAGKLWGSVGCGVKSTDYACIDTSSGALLFESPVVLLEGIVGDETHIYMSGEALTPVPNRCNGGWPLIPGVHSVSSTGSLLWTADVPKGTLMLTDSGGVLVRDGWSLSAVDPSGRIAFTCPMALPPAQNPWLFGPPPVLNGGIWIEAVNSSLLAAYEVPGYELASKGWVAPRGNLRRNGKPLWP